MMWLEYLVVFIFGSAIGSFLNVVIYRVPKGENIAFPASHCPHCDRNIKPYENIPILSYVSLGGRCRGCKERISIQYPVVEAITGGFAVLMLNQFGWSTDFLFYSYFAAILIALSVIDIQTYRLPNPITLIGAIGAILMMVIFKRDVLLFNMIGGLAGVGSLLFMWLTGRLLFRKATLGMGDIKLAGMIGLFLGPWHTFGMFVFGVFMGAFVGVILIAVGGKKWGQKIPFGPYLAAGAIVSLLWGVEIWRWYIGISFN